MWKRQESPCHGPREESKTSPQVPVSQKTREGGRVPISAGHEEVTGDVSRTWVWWGQILDDNGGPCRKFHTEKFSCNGEDDR